MNAFYRAFYLLCFFVAWKFLMEETLLWRQPAVISQGVEIWLVMPFYQHLSKMDLLIWQTGLMATIMLALLKPECRWIRLLVAAFFLWNAALFFSMVGRISHSLHAWIFVLFAAVCADKRSLLEFGQRFIGITIGFSGIWKLVGFASSLMHRESPLWFHRVVNYDHLMGSSGPGIALVVEFPNLANFLFSLNTILQLAVLVLVFLPRSCIITGYLVLGFHFLTTLFLGPMFSPQILLAFFVFFVGPYLPIERIGQERNHIYQ